MEDDRKAVLDSAPAYRSAVEATLDEYGPCTLRQLHEVMAADGYVTRARKPLARRSVEKAARHLHDAGRLDHGIVGGVSVFAVVQEV